MIRFSLALVAGCMSSALGSIQFINPPPFGTIRDFSNSESYTTGTTVNIVWTAADSGKGVSLVLYQLNSTGIWYGDMEYLTQGAVDVTRYTWLVGSRKNLTQSNLFYLSIYQEGKSTSDANSHYFYIANKVVQSSSGASSTLPTTSASSVLPSTAAQAGSTSSPTTLNDTPRSSTAGLSAPSATSQTPQSSGTSNAFPVGAKIGIGVGIPVALAIGLGIGFLLFRRRKKKDVTVEVETLDRAPFYPSKDPSENVYKPEGHFYGSNLNEAPPKSPIEIAPQWRQSYHTPHRLEEKPNVVTVRYEM